uniref:Uncharacterized protein n=1 Tax=uncultured marine virus TaxID=186617 RepID=A0A0F7L8T4_9VIRU|nr:hypothetical protein [uncultured marine virus]
MSEHYSKEYLDEVHRNLGGKLDQILDQVKFTNGKVKKITLALVLIGGFVVGLGLKEFNTIIAFFI